MERDVSMRISGMALLATLLAACASPPGEPPLLELTGPWLGQTPPGDTAVLFAPGIVSTGMYTRDMAVTPDGSEMYFGVIVGSFSTILQTHRTPDGWTRPEVAPFARDPRFFNLEPAISPDGQRFFFLSTRVPGGRDPEPGEIRSWANQDIWVMDRVGDGWGEPYNLGPPVDSDDAEFFPSVTRDGTMYFTRSPAGGRESYIYRARWLDGAYQEPERLGPEVNATASQYNAFIDPDERYLIVCTAGLPDTRGGTDYYVVFRNDDDTWSAPVNLGDAVNTRAGGEFSPYVSPDGRYLFFMSTRPLPDTAVPDTLSLDFLTRYRAGPESGNAGIYWIDASFIQELRPPAAEP